MGFFFLNKTEVFSPWYKGFINDWVGSHKSLCSLPGVSVTMQAEMQSQILIGNYLNCRHVNMNGQVFLAVFGPREIVHVRPAPPTIAFFLIPFIIFIEVGVLKKVNKNNLFRWLADILYIKQLKSRDTWVPRSIEQSTLDLRL